MNILIQALPPADQHLVMDQADHLDLPTVNLMGTMLMTMVVVIQQEVVTV